MNDGHPPVIQCTPPSDARFLATVSSAFRQSSELLSGELAVLLGTTARIRSAYPRAAIIAVSVGPIEDDPSPVWLVSRDGWTEVA